MIRSRILAQAFESSDLEGAVVNDTPELDPVEDEQLTQEISQDEQAIEECSVALDDVIDEQGNLIEQDVTTVTVTEPQTEDVIQSEVALEAALIRMGTTRYKEGYHSFPKSAVSLSHENLKQSLQLAHEGIKDFLIKIGKAIKELFLKIIRFFKKLFAKLRIKLGGYSKKLDKLNEAMKSIQGGESVKDSGKADDVKKALNELNLASVSYFVKEQNSSPYPVANATSLSSDIVSLSRDFQSAIIDVKKDASLFAKAVNAIKNKFLPKLKKALTSNAEADKNFANKVGAFKDGKISSSENFFAIGCAGKNFYGVLVDASDLSVQEADTDGKESYALKWFSAEYLEQVENLNLKQLVDSFVNNYSKVKKACDETPRVFKEIDGVHSQFEKLADEISKPVENDNDAQTAKACNGLIKNIKQLAVDLPSQLIKTHVHTIRDYLVIGNVVVKTCSGESKK